jgi:hypothetical protein
MQASIKETSQDKHLGHTKHYSFQLRPTKNKHDKKTVYIFGKQNRPKRGKASSVEAPIITRWSTIGW